MSLDISIAAVRNACSFRRTSAMLRRRVSLLPKRIGQGRTIKIQVHFNVSIRTISRGRLCHFTLVPRAFRFIAYFDLDSYRDVKFMIESAPPTKVGVESFKDADNFARPRPSLGDFFEDAFGLLINLRNEETGGLMLQKRKNLTNLLASKLGNRLMLVDA